MGRPIVRHLSELARESLRQPGSWRCLEIVYRNEPRTLLDRLWLSSRAARGARNRLQILTEELCAIVLERAQRDGTVNLLSLGSGPGHEILGCLEQVQDCIHVEATCVDRDPEALRYGRMLAAQKDLDGSVNYVRGNVLGADALPACQDVAVLSGLLDYFDSEAAVSVLTRVREKLKPGGIVLLANMRRHRLASTMSLLGNWQLVYREPSEVERLLAESGYCEVEVWLEPEKVFCIGSGGILSTTAQP
ncbi:MAG: class I SAM-dependent methyltransferase family protein [Planctomycetota bacterium]|nr:class I SAM-dependent methyltransferase family protein [Planctomycetota bacterium]